MMLVIFKFYTRNTWVRHLRPKFKVHFCVIFLSFKKLENADFKYKVSLISNTNQAKHSWFTIYNGFFCQKFLFLWLLNFCTEINWSCSQIWKFKIKQLVPLQRVTFCKYKYNFRRHLTAAILGQYWAILLYLQYHIHMTDKMDKTFYTLYPFKRYL